MGVILLTGTSTTDGNSTIAPHLYRSSRTPSTRMDAPTPLLLPGFILLLIGGGCLFYGLLSTLRISSA
jgi:hypothetical protein